MRRGKGSRRIMVNNTEYRWRATGDDGYISIGIWPVNQIGAYISGAINYHATMVDNGDGSWTSKGDQIVVTSRFIRRIIEYAITSYGYNPDNASAELRLGALDSLINWDEAIRVTDIRSIDSTHYELK